MDNEIQKTVKRAHNLHLENGRKLTVSAVKGVPVFNDKEIIVELDERTLTVSGTELILEAVNLESGTVTASGGFSGFRYGHGGGKQSLLKRILK
ncbi:MAG: hypothetical protein LBC13_00285 [Clostridiales bacterium]|jgi:sporulation protein YabP|nr:hypothetical protein [Clostridiales bacterium]